MYIETARHHTEMVKFLDQSIFPFVCIRVRLQQSVSEGNKDEETDKKYFQLLPSQKETKCLCLQTQWA